MKVAELEGALLDYWVARATNDEDSVALKGSFFGGHGCYLLNTEDNRWLLHTPSKSWADGGPIIEREKISTWRYDDAYGNNLPQNTWFAAVGGVHGWDDGSVVSNYEATGETALVAAMRAYVASKFGEEVDGAPSVTG